MRKKLEVIFTFTLPDGVDATDEKIAKAEEQISSTVKDYVQEHAIEIIKTEFMDEILEKVKEDLTDTLLEPFKNNPLFKITKG